MSISPLSFSLILINIKYQLTHFFHYDKISSEDNDTHYHLGGVFMIKTSDLNFSYGSKSILKNINFEAESGEVISLLGPNGCGKSTLLKSLAGLFNSVKPSILINSRPINHYSKKDLAKEIAFLPQFQEKLEGMTVRDVVALGRTPYHKTGWFYSDEDNLKINEALSYLNLLKFQNRQVDELSGGERQRVFIAMVLAQNTPIVLLDEPVTYMDIKHQWDLLDLIHRLKEDFGKTIISVFHDINHAMEVSDKVYLMKGGAIFKVGDCNSVVTKENLKEVFDIQAQVCKVNYCSRNIVVPHGFQHNYKKKCKKCI